MSCTERADRRRLLLLAAASAAMGSWPRSASPQPRLADDPFALGVASGSPRPDGVVLWTRLLLDTPLRQAVPVRWEIADGEGFGRIVARGEAWARPELGHAVHVEVQGLASDRWYAYRFLAGDAASPTGRTRTLPAEDVAAARLRIGYASCQRWEHGFFAAWRHLREEQPDLVLFLGDYIYEYPTSWDAVRSPGGNWVATLADYRERYALYRSDPDLQAMHAACPWLPTWDDHEVQNDYAGGHRGSQGLPVADFAARRAAAYQAWYEHMPVRAATLVRGLGGLPLRVHGETRFGRLASLLLLDTRQHKDLQACTPGGLAGAGRLDPRTCQAWADPARSMLGAAQEQWLEARLAAGGATWTVLGQSTLFGLRAHESGRGTVWNDGWDGYPAARRRLTDALQRHAVANPVVLGGDVHENWVGQVKADYAQPGSADLGVEFCGTSISSRPTASPRLAPLRLAANPHFLFADAAHRGYGVAEFTPRSLQVRLRVLDDVRRPDSGVRTLASFQVAAGSRRVEQA